MTTRYTWLETMGLAGFAPAKWTELFHLHASRSRHIHASSEHRWILISTISSAWLCIEKPDTISTLLKATTSHCLCTSDSQSPFLSGADKLHWALTHVLPLDKFLQRETCRMLPTSVRLVQIPRCIGGETERSREVKCQACGGTFQFVSSSGLSFSFLFYYTTATVIILLPTFLHLQNKDLCAKYFGYIWDRN